jgi:hypothetical protein
MRNSFRKLVAAGLLALSTAGCGLYYVTSAQWELCNTVNEYGWARVPDGVALHRGYGPYRTAITVRALSHDSELQIALSAPSVPTDARTPPALFDPATAWAESGGKRVQLFNLTGDPNSLVGTNCERTVSNQVDLGKCTLHTQRIRSAEIFPTTIKLHLGPVSMAEATYALPPITFCYVPGEARGPRIHM